MDNQQSSPQIIFPNVPDDFCPTGNWQEVLQEFIDIVLSNGTINVPGLGDVTPAKIEEIEDELQDLQNQITSNDSDIASIQSQLQNIPHIRQGIITGVAAGNSTQTVTFATFETSNYSVAFTPISSNYATAQAPVISIGSTKTSSSFSVYISNNTQAGNPIVVDIMWMAIHP